MKRSERDALKRGLVPKGWAVEVTLKTTGGTYRRTDRGRRRRVRDRRPLYVKIVVTADRDLTVEEHERIVRRTIQAGAVQPGFKLRIADWEKGKGRTLKQGRIRNASELVAFYGALRHPNTKIRADMVMKEDL